ncbi:MAG: pyruvate dehydrogenase complex dihydrolipoamide acetyltransferase [Cytophagales bacterium]
MAEIIRMPKMSDTMVEGVIAAWHKKVGDKVKAGDLLAEVETDKATMELESYDEGVLLHIGIPEKSTVPVDGMIAIIGKEGEDISALLGGSTSPKKLESPSSTKTEKTVAVDVSNIPASIIRMPKMSDTMVEGNIVAWHKKVGDKVKSGELLAEVETDKATMELESYEDGILLHIGVEAGNSIKVDGIIAVIGKEGADWKTLIEASSSPVKSIQTPKVATTSTPDKTEVKETESQNNSDRVFASPLAKAMAKEKGIDIAAVKGSGENGRITKKDIENYQPVTTTVTTEKKAPTATPVMLGKESFDELGVNQMRKTIARRLSESLFTAPHFYLTMEIDMDNAIKARQSMNEMPDVKVSFNDMVIKAVAAALRKHPMANASWQGDKIKVNHHIHIGVAMAVEDGLLVPVVRFADQKSLSQISAEVKEYSGKAKSKKLQPSDWEGNTFTISNLGMFGIDEFTSILNSPEACIMSVGGIKQTPVVKNGQIVPGNIMKVTLGCDHRVVDGAVGAAFLQTFKAYMEDPVRILI